MSGEESCPVCMALTPEQKIQFCVPSYKQRKKLEKSVKVDKTEKLVDLSSISVINPAISDDHMETMDTPEPDSSEAQFKKFNELFACRFTRLESLLAKVSSQEQVDSLAIHPSPISSAPAPGTSGVAFQGPASTALVSLDTSFQAAPKSSVIPIRLTSTGNLSSSL